jgi:hypothetical protein
MSAQPAEQHQFAPFWGIHSEKDEQPQLRGWAKTEDEAKQKMAEIQKDDDDADTEYWVIQMTEAEADSFKTAGVIPEDA